MEDAELCERFCRLDARSGSPELIFIIRRSEVPSRRSLSTTIRAEAAAIAHDRAHPGQLNNGDESEHRNGLGELSYIGNFHKGLRHNVLGELDDPAHYRAMVNALSNGAFAGFEAIPLALADGRKLVNPQAGLAFDLQGPDAQSLAMPPAPRLDSAEEAAEMAELYWMALLRDVHFSDYAADPGVGDAATSLSNDFSDFRGPKSGGLVTRDTIFRGITPGDLAGPYVSQYLLRRINYGTIRITQRQRTAAPNQDYMIDFTEWLSVQNGADVNPAQAGTFDPVRRYIRNMRDLATYVHFDALYEAYLNACLILLDLQVPFDPANPYVDSRTQEGFGTFGGPHILSLVTEVATRALKAVWYQKWYSHRRLRPEAMGGLVHNHLAGAASYPINPEILVTGPGSIADRIRAHNAAMTGGAGTYLLPMAFREGSPMHPAYGAGHATVAGACVTILKAWFDESFVLPGDTVVSNADGTALITAPSNPDLTVSGELNKLAANISIGRNMAGVHWRTDYTESIKLGEAVAIGLLEEQKLCYNESSGLGLTRFDGTRITI